MEEILMRYGYISHDAKNWFKQDWTVRIDDTSIEIFNNPDKAPGKYYIGPIDKVDIENYLNEIDDYLIKE